jgi:uncharacterized tellurite resistance protein B-like protein
MGLFDVFKSEPIKLTPRLTLAVGLIYMMAADGQIEEEELGHIQSVVGNDVNLIQTAIKYVRSVKLDQFLVDAPALVNDAQKLCLLINVCDLLLSDGKADPTEQQLFHSMLNAFGVSQDTFKPYFDVILAKNNRSVFNV